jgi:plasmid stability protein
MSSLFLREFPDDLRRRVKSAAALQGVTMRDWIVDALREAIDRQEKTKKGGKSDGNRKVS